MRAGLRLATPSIFTSLTIKKPSCLLPARLPASRLATPFRGAERCTRRKGARVLCPPPTRNPQCRGAGLRREPSLARPASFRPRGPALLRTLLLSAPLAEGCAALSTGSESEGRLSERETESPAARGPAGELEGGEGTGAGKRSSAGPFARLPGVLVHRLAEYRPHLGGIGYTGQGVTFPVPSPVLSLCGFLD